MAGAGAGTAAGAGTGGEAPAIGRPRRDKLPLVSIAKLHLGVRSIRVVDRSRPGSAPLVVSDLRFRNASPVALLGPDPGSNPPIALTLAASVAPLVRSVRLDLQAAPFAAEPSLVVGLALDGLRGAGLTELLPALAAGIDGRELTDGRFRLRLAATLEPGRRDPLELDLAKPFGAELSVADVELRNGEEGPVLVGLSSIHVEATKVDPATGDVHLRSFAIEHPAARILKSKEGLHVAGLILKAPPEPGPAAAAAPASGPAPAAGPGPASPPAPVPALETVPARRRPEIRVDELSIVDCALDYADRSVEPPFLLPIEYLTVEIADASTRALEERVSFRFGAIVKGGTVSLPKRRDDAGIPGVGLVTGMIGDAGEMVGAIEAAAPVMELRSAFDEITVKADLALSPHLAGAVIVSVAGVELANLGGLAASKGSNLRDGVLDLEATALFDDAGNLELRTTTRITDLDLSEAENGFFRRVLKLPAPLNAVIFALRDDEGTITVSPPPVRVPAGGVSRSAIAAAIVSALGGVVIDALAAVPLRAAGSVVDLGKGIISIVPGSGYLPFMSGPAAPEPPATLAFAPGDATLPADLADLGRIVARARDEDDAIVEVRHDLGGGDLARARLLANPGRDDRRALMTRLRARRDELQARRADVAADARAASILGLEARAAAAMAVVRRLEDRIGGLERAIGPLLDQERDGAERQAERRARAACTALARARLDAVERALLEAGFPDEKRVRVLRPRVAAAEGTAGGTVTIGLARRKKP